MRPATLPAQQAFPQLYITRPDRRIVPLVALDELPSWLQIGDWDWTDIRLYKGMSAATPDPVPRLGEYDVICHNCCSHIDVLHRSISQRSEAAQNSCSDDDKPSTGSAAATENKSCSGTVIHNPQQYQRPAVISSGGFLPLLPLPQPAFHGYLRPALPGMCYVGVRPPCWSEVLDPSMGGGVKLPDPSISGSGSSPRRALNPEAPDFSPGTASCSPSPSRFPSLDPTPPSSMSPGPMSTGSKDGPKEDTKKDIAGAPSAAASSASSAKSNDVLLEELKRAVGIKPRRKATTPACRRKPPMPNLPKEKFMPFQPSAKKKARGRRRAKKVMRKRFGKRNVSFEPLCNSATKRQERRGRMVRGHKEVAAGGYWHAMMVPAWAARGRR